MYPYDELNPNDFPPPGHPHYIPMEVREAARQKALHPYDPEEEKPKMTSAAATKFQELKAKIAEARKQMEETARTAFTDMAKELFDENPELLGFGWTQYTPYWNDGEECTFRANTDYPTIKMNIDGQVLSYDGNRGELETEDGEEVRTAELWSREVFEAMPKFARVSPIVVEGKSIAYDWTTKTTTIDGVKVRSRSDYDKFFDGLENKVSKFLGAFEDDDLETMFGDHVEVTVGRDGSVETEEHQHD